MRSLECQSYAQRTTDNLQQRDPRTVGSKRASVSGKRVCLEAESQTWAELSIAREADDPSVFTCPCFLCCFPGRGMPSLSISNCSGLGDNQSKKGFLNLTCSFFGPVYDES